MRWVCGTIVFLLIEEELERWDIYLKKLIS